VKTHQIVLFGDSYAAGRIPHTQRDGALAEALGGLVAYDYAASGSTAAQWSADSGGRLTKVCGCDADVAAGSLGGNDAFAALADGTVTDGEKIVALASLFHVLMRLRRKRVILMLYPDPFQGSRPDAAAGHRQLVEAIRAVASYANEINGNVVLLDLSEVLGPEHFDGEDIHPNEDGYAAMAAAVRKLIAAL
jgi:lysophospholipase L1-like esterase